MEPVIATSLFTTGIETLSSTYTHVVDENGLNSEAVNEVIATTLGVATASATLTITDKNIRKQAEMYSNAYVESMSDEELTDALEKMNLLLSEDDQIKNSKTI